jgi:hypothetical protein
MDEPDGSSPDLGVRLILEAFRLYRVPVSQTRGLRDLRHDLHLLPQLRDQLDDLLRCIPADQHIEYDVQGLRDQGTDVVVRLAASGRESYVCFQVKSHKEIEDSDLVAKLRVRSWPRTCRLETTGSLPGFAGLVRPLRRSPAPW